MAVVKRRVDHHLANAKERRLHNLDIDIQTRSSTAELTNRLIAMSWMLLTVLDNLTISVCTRDTNGSQALRGTMYGTSKAKFTNVGL